MTPMPPPPPPDAALADLRSEGGSSPTSKVASCFRASCEWPTSSKSSVASCPTRSSNTSSPPGWSSRYLLTSNTLPSMISQASAGPECVATSARVLQGWQGWQGAFVRRPLPGEANSAHNNAPNDHSLALGPAS
eukprot:scaffold132040_cov57-Phaeocystis_antarctica.AAC.3